MQVNVRVTFDGSQQNVDDVRAQLDEFFVTTAHDHYGESFVAQPADGDCILRGLIELSTHPIEHLHQMTHWGRALSQARQRYPELNWLVELDGHPVPWEDGRGYGTLILNDEDIDIIDYALQNF